MIAMKKTVFLLLGIIVCIWSVNAQSSGRLNLTFMGDIMAHDVNYRMKNYNLIYEDVKDLLLNDDLSFANLEFPVDGDLPYSTYPRFNVHSAYVFAAVKAGIEVFSLANNHSLDQGAKGVQKTLLSLVALKQRFGGRLYFSGIRKSLEQKITPQIIYRNGLKIGFLAVTQFSNLPQDKPYINVVDYNDEKQAKSFLAMLKKITGAYDLFILSFHGGIEYATEPDPKKVTFFKALIDAGVDIVYGHHPHVLQPFKIITKNGNKKLIIYSMGNFISGQTWFINPKKPYSKRANTGDSVLLRVSVVITGGNSDIDRVEPIPITHYIKPDKDIVVRRLKPLAARKLHGFWSRYYQVRLELMKEFLHSLSITP